MLGYRVDDIVWVQLGVSYGWWPGQVQDGSNLAQLSQDILQSLGPEFCDDQSPGEPGDVLLVRFFDDDSKEWLRIREKKRLKNYSCKDKKKLISAGFKKLDEERRGTSGLGGVNLRLAQFYKDVELAEVLTDNDPQVANILAEYEVRETEAQPPPETEVSHDQPEKSSGKKKSVLREIKNGRVGKTSKGRGKKKR